MDERKKKVAIDELQVLLMKSQQIVWEITNQLSEDDFDNDFKLIVAIEHLDAMYQELIEVVNQIC